MGKKTLYLGGLWDLTSNLGLPKFQGRKTSSQSRYMYNKGKNNTQFSYILIYENMGHNAKTKFIIGYSEGPGWPFNNQTISIYKYNMEAICSGFILSCRINNEVSADAAQDAAAYVTTTKL